MSDERLLPRSVLLSIWLEHLEVGAAQIEKAVHAVQGDDEPHEVLWPDGSSGSLGDLFGFWTASTRQVAAVLPVAGDLSGLSCSRTPSKIRIKDQKSTRLNSKHVAISYPVSCL